jgi:hypothetical protein
MFGTKKIKINLSIILDNRHGLAGFEEQQIKTIKA